jgi:hypothetical protein
MPAAVPGFRKRDVDVPAVTFKASNCENDDSFFSGFIAMLFSPPAFRRC